MTENILVAVAWPYANGSLHLGHMAGAYLPADIFARYHRMAGNGVLMVSGSDQHGTPITVRADNEGSTPQDVVDQFHPEFSRYWSELGITVRSASRRPAQRTTSRRRAGLLHSVSSRRATSTRARPSSSTTPQAARFLPDRYVEGTCPNCGYEEARGDQCDNCGTHARPRGPDQPALPLHRHDAGDARNGALLLQAERLQRAAAASG